MRRVILLFIASLFLLACNSKSGTSQGSETSAENHVALSPDEVLVFPKVVAPTGAYSEVQAGAKVGTNPARPVRLLDYEAELGMVLLDDLDLNAPPGSYTEFINRVADDYTEMLHSHLVNTPMYRGYQLNHTNLEIRTQN